MNLLFDEEVVVIFNPDGQGKGIYMIRGPWMHLTMEHRRGETTVV